MAYSSSKISKHFEVVFINDAKTLSPGKTIEQSWIQHPTLLDVNVEIVQNTIQHCWTKQATGASWR